jgi:hypothetical protein
MSGAGNSKGNKDNKDNKDKALDIQNAILASQIEKELKNAPPAVQDQLRSLLQQMALGGGGAAAAGASGSGKEPKSMDDHKFWKTQPVVKHGNHTRLLLLIHFLSRWFLHLTRTTKLNGFVISLLVTYYR